MPKKVFGSESVDITGDRSKLKDIYFGVITS